jgi:hypothetical protein
MMNEAHSSRRHKALLALLAAFLLLTACALEMARHPDEAPPAPSQVEALLFSGSPDCRQAGCSLERPLMKGTRELLVLRGPLHDLTQKPGALITSHSQVATAKRIPSDLQADLGLPDDVLAYEVSAHEEGETTFRWLQSDGAEKAQFSIRVQEATTLTIKQLAQKDDQGVIQLAQKARLRFFVQAHAGAELLYASSGFSMEVQGDEVLGLLASDTSFREIHRFFEARQIAAPRDQVQEGWGAASLVGLNAGKARLQVQASGGAQATAEVKVSGVENSL